MTASDTIMVEPLTGPALSAALPAVARLRIDVFRAYPYLYDGSEAYETRYLAEFAAAPGAIVVAARVPDGTIVGVSTGMPMIHAAPQFAAPFRARGDALETLFYFGESVLDPRFRGRGLGHAFFDAREAHARSIAGITHTTFCAVVRAPDHPARPANYVPLDAFWQRRGYESIPGLTTKFSWKDIDQPVEDDKTMQFWLRRLT